MKVAIIGSRTFNDYRLVFQVCQICLTWSDLEIVSGGAQGADSLGERFAREHNLKFTCFPADWDLHGKSAGFIRNEQIVKYSDFIIAFWDGKSKGTKSSIDLAFKHKKLILVATF